MEFLVPIPTCPHYPGSIFPFRRNGTGTHTAAQAPNRGVTLASVPSPCHIQPKSPFITPPKFQPHLGSCPGLLTGGPYLPRGATAMIALERLPLALASRGGPLPQPLCPSQRSAVSPLSHVPSASLRDLAALVVSGQATPPVLEARVIILLSREGARGPRGFLWRRWAPQAQARACWGCQRGPFPGPRAPSASAGRGPPRGSGGPRKSWKDGFRESLGANTRPPIPVHPALRDPPQGLPDDAPALCSRVSQTPPGCALERTAPANSGAADPRF